MLHALFTPAEAAAIERAFAGAAAFLHAQKVLDMASRASEKARNSLCLTSLKTGDGAVDYEICHARGWHVSMFRVGLSEARYRSRLTAGFSLQ